jgi:hypothetical protein
VPESNAAVRFRQRRPLPRRLAGAAARARPAGVVAWSRLAGVVAWSRRRPFLLAVVAVAVAAFGAASPAARLEPSGQPIRAARSATASRSERITQPPPPADEPPLEDGGDAAGALSGAAPLAPPMVRPRSVAPRKTAAPTSTPTPFTAVAGESCPTTGSSGYYHKGWSSDWYARGSGGWDGDGCAGRMIGVPMSGDPDTDDSDNVVVWWFRVPAAASCAISVQVPDTGRPLDAAGAPATYFLYASPDASGAAIGRFTLDQVHNQGRWLSAGTYTAATGRMSVRMVTRGIDWGTGRAGAHLGVSAVRVTC